MCLLVILTSDIFPLRLDDFVGVFMMLLILLSVFSPFS